MSVLTWIGIFLITMAVVVGMFLSMVAMSKSYDEAFKEWERDEKRKQNYKSE